MSAVANEFGAKPAREIDAQRFDDMLGVLPPCKWYGHGTNQESFHVSEFLSGNIVSWFVQLNGRYFQIDDACTLTHRELIAMARRVRCGASRRILRRAHQRLHPRPGHR